MTGGEKKLPIFVIGFPKSGNTWLARMLAEVTHSNISVHDPADVVNAADNSLERSGKYEIYKEHVVQNVEKVLRSKTVYIVRDVRDVLVSGFFHCNRWATNKPLTDSVFYKLYFEHEVKKLNDRWQGNFWSEFYYSVRTFLATLVRKGRRNVRVGSWSDHVKYWIHLPGVIVVRYEDLLDDTENELRKILRSLSIDASDEDIKKCVVNQSFAKKKATFLNSQDDRNATFLRSGKSGDWRNYLSPTLGGAVEKKHASMMAEMGYAFECLEEEDK